MSPASWRTASFEVGLRKLGNPSREGVTTLLPVLPDTLSSVLAHPLSAGGLGLALGTLLLLSSRASFRLLTPDNPAGLLSVGALLLLRMGFVAAALFAYRRFAPAGVPVFAATLAAGFLVTYWVELVRYAGLLRTRPRAVRQGWR